MQLIDASPHANGMEGAQKKGVHGMRVFGASH
jgi:hypothetical protein